ncbi:hypothetical protein FQA39_LY07648 [Lamprigera yunnana]|nr:hypothetical protein FQA39_LY07648 [Lamprigera yunnana]
MMRWMRRFVLSVTIAVLLAAVWRRRCVPFQARKGCWSETCHSESCVRGGIASEATVRRSVCSLVVMARDATIETISIKQKTREAEGQEKIEILQEEEVEEQTKLKERNDNCKEDKVMQMLIQMNSAMLNKFEENNQKLEETNKKLEEKMLNKLEETNKKNHKKLDKIRTRRWRNFKDDNGKGSKEQGNEVIDVEAKMNQDREEKIQMCKDLKEQSKDIVNYIEEKTEIRNSTRNKMNTNYRKGKYRNFQESWKEFIKNYWGTKKQSVMQGEWYGISISCRLRKLEEELQKKVMIFETKKFNELMRILEVHYQCEKDRVKDNANKYYN